jgi:hypothetical protein
MSNTDNNLGSKHVPEQTIGAEINASSTETFESEALASTHYSLVKARLLDVNKWYEYAKLPLSSFKLFDHACRVADRAATEGDYIRIDIPGPGTKTGHGYDWVQIETIIEESNEHASVFSMTVRPSAHPLSDDHHTAHFLTEVASSTFQVKRLEKAVTAEQHGRNELPNTDTAHTFDNFRNTVVGWSSMLGFSYPQWKGLVKGIIKRS